jgi:hypothetical protein
MQTQRMSRLAGVRNAYSVLVIESKRSQDDNIKIHIKEIICGRPQWPSGLGHKLSSPAQTLGAWVRIQLEAWMSVCVYSLCVVLCVSRDHATG